MRPIKTVFYSSHFGKAFKKLQVSLQSEVVKKEAIFRRDCFDSKLRTHKLKGKNQDLWSFSVTQKHRVVFRFIFDDTVLFIDIGDHSIYQ
ncbi:MAG TPA: type II toxin-antitoxin system mRNA interferase toxin, RelE/StbE family [Patescibacteria group bacterium]